MTEQESHSPAALVGGILLLFAAGMPMIAFLWETLNRLLSGVVEPARLGLSVPVLLLFIGLLAWTRRLMLGDRGRAAADDAAKRT